MDTHGAGIARISATVAIATLVALTTDAADRTAGVITPEGSPVWIDPWRATLFDTPALWVSITNRHSAPVAFTLRVWVFDQSNQLRGTTSWCVSTAVDRSMRGVFHIPLEIRGVTARDRGVVTVESAVGGRVRWALRETPEEQLAAALDNVRGSSGRLSMERLDRDERAVHMPMRVPAGAGDVRADLRARRRRVRVQSDGSQRLRGRLYLQVAATPRQTDARQVYRLLLTL
jgi:hypothetical protein